MATCFAFGVAASPWAPHPGRVGVTRIHRGGVPSVSRSPASARPLAMAAAGGGGGGADHPPPSPPSEWRGWAGVAIAAFAAAAAALVVALPPAGAARAASRRGGGVAAETSLAAVDPASASASTRPVAAGAVTAVAVPADSAAATPVRRPTAAAPAAPPEGLLLPSSRAFLDRLAAVPVFLITSSTGQPFLATADASDARVALIFFSPTDADGMAANIRASGADAIVYVLGLDKAYQMVKAPPMPSGLPPAADGVSPYMVFRFCPDGRQVRAAEAIRKAAAAGGPGEERGGGAGKRGAAARAAKVPPIEGVPVFVAKGLTLRRGGAATGGGPAAPNGAVGLMVPLFLTREDVDDAWAKLREHEADLPAQATVEVGSLMHLLQEMETNGGAAGEVALGVFPPRESVDYVAKLQAAAAAGGGGGGAGGGGGVAPKRGGRAGR